MTSNPFKQPDPPVKKNAFVHKLYGMLNDSNLSHLIWWTGNPKGHTFSLYPSKEFAVALSGYFKHGNVASFVRQLHMYGFHKVSDPSMSIQGDRSTPVWEFRHSSGKFKKGDESSLVHIKRRSQSNSSRNSIGDNAVSGESISHPANEAALFDAAQNKSHTFPHSFAPNNEKNVARRYSQPPLSEASPHQTFGPNINRSYQNYSSYASQNMNTYSQAPQTSTLPECSQPNVIQPFPPNHAYYQQYHRSTYPLTSQSQYTPFPPQSFSHINSPASFSMYQNQNTTHTLGSLAQTDQSPAPTSFVHLKHDISGVSEKAPIAVLQSVTSTTSVFSTGSSSSSLAAHSTNSGVFSKSPLPNPDGPVESGLSDSIGERTKQDNSKLYFRKSFDVSSTERSRLPSLLFDPLTQVAPSDRSSVSNDVSGSEGVRLPPLRNRSSIKRSGSANQEKLDPLFERDHSSVLIPSLARERNDEASGSLSSLNHSIPAPIGEVSRAVSDPVRRSTQVFGNRSLSDRIRPSLIELHSSQISNHPSHNTTMIRGTDSFGSHTSSVFSNNFSISSNSTDRSSSFGSVSHVVPLVARCVSPHAEIVTSPHEKDQTSIPIQNDSTDGQVSYMDSTIQETREPTPCVESTPSHEPKLEFLLDSPDDN